ncbi:MAG: response regulator [bacterium]|nr:response regulator [bacterium]
MATIVILDDVDALRQMYVDVFRSLGHRVLDFDDAAPALETVNFAEVDLVITDLDMPTDGRTAIRCLRDRGETVPIVVLSGSFHLVESDELLGLGAQAVIRKPVPYRDLLKVVLDLLDKVPAACKN